MPSGKRMVNRSRLELSNRHLVLGNDPLCRPSKNLLGRKASRGFDFLRLVFRTSKELPNERHRSRILSEAKSFNPKNVFPPFFFLWLVECPLEGGNADAKNFGAFAFSMPVDV
jgi:hypothetical protein